MESKLVKEFPGYHYYLYAARKLGLAMGLNAVEHYMGFYGGQSEDGVHRGMDGSEALYDYICSKICWMRAITCGKCCLFPVMMGRYFR